MVRTISVVLGVGLMMAWLAGLDRGATPWLSWLDAIGSLAAFTIAFGLPLRYVAAGAKAVPAAALGVSLVVLGAIGLALGATAWLDWWTLGFGCGFLGLAAATAARGPRTAPPLPI
jgi:hypothetical protein